LTNRWRDIYVGPGTLHLTSTTGTSGSGTDYTDGTLSFTGTNLILGTTNFGSNAGGAISLLSNLPSGTGSTSLSLLSGQSLTDTDNLLRIGDNDNNSYFAISGDGSAVLTPDAYTSGDRNAFTVNLEDQSAGITNGILVNINATSGGARTRGVRVVGTNNSADAAAMIGLSTSLRNNSANSASILGVSADVINTGTIGSVMNGIISTATNEVAATVGVQYGGFTGTYNYGTVQDALWGQYRGIVNEGSVANTFGAEVNYVINTGSLNQVKFNENLFYNSGTVGYLQGLNMTIGNSGNIGSNIIGSLIDIDTDNSTVTNGVTGSVIAVGTGPNGIINESLVGLTSGSDNYGIVNGNLSAIDGNVINAGTVGGNITGLSLSTDTIVDTAANMYGINVGWGVAGSKVNSHYGLNISTVGKGLTNNYGIYLNGAVGGSGENYPLYINSGDAFINAGGLKLSDTSNTTAGMVRWTGSDFEGSNGTSWLSLTSGSGSNPWSVIGSDIYYTAGKVNVGTSVNYQALNVGGNIILENSDLGVILNDSEQPIITRGLDRFQTGNYAGIGRWGLFQEPGRLTLGIPDFNGTGIRFSTYNDDSTIASNLVDITRDGNVGIGFNNPSSKLQVNGNIAFAETYYSMGVGSRFIGIPCSTAGSFCNDSGASIEFTQGGTNSISNELRFYTHQSGSSAGERMRLDEAGNLGIGFNNPSSKLQVNGNIAFAETY